MDYLQTNHEHKYNQSTLFPQDELGDPLYGLLYIAGHAFDENSKNRVD